MDKSSEVRCNWPPSGGALENDTANGGKGRSSMVARNAGDGDVPVTGGSVVRRGRRLLVAALAVPLACASGGCTGGAKGQDSASGTVRLGLLASLTGPAAAAGTQAKRGAQLAVDLINQPSPGVRLPVRAGHGGLAHARLDLVSVDTADDSGQAGEQAARLVDRGVAGVVEADGPESARASGLVLQRSGMGVVVARSAAQFLTEQGLDKLARLGPDDRTLAQTLFRFLAAHPQIRHLGLLVGGDVESVGLQRLVSELADEAGYPPTTAAEVDNGDAAGPARQVLNSTPDAVIALAGQGTDATAMLTALGAAEHEGGGHATVPVLAAGTGFTDPGAPANPAADAGGLTVLRVTPYSAELATRGKLGSAVNTLFTHQYGTGMDTTAALAFTATLTLAAAVDRAGSAGAGPVAASLADVNLSGQDLIVPWPAVKFGGDGQNTGAAAVIEQLTSAGAVVVFPAEVAHTQLALPAGTGGGPAADLPLDRKAGS
jgi:branched-chain amino acid transport system substrate-binding protein